MKDTIIGILFSVFLVLFFGAVIDYIIEEIRKEDNETHIHLAPLRVYQIEIESQDTFSVWDGNRLVKKFFLTDDTEIGNMIIYDQK